MRSSNPAFRGDLLQQSTANSWADSARMSIQGTAVKTIIALFLVVLSAAFTWNRFEQAGGFSGGGMQAVMPFMWGGLICGLIVALVTMFKPALAMYTTPVYALAEGCFVGGISAIVSAQFGGKPIVFQATCLTFGTLFTMLVGYQTGWIRATEKFRAGVMAATGAVMLIYLISMGMRFFGSSMPYIHDGGMIGIGFSVFVVGLAALNLILDFDLIERMAVGGAPKHMEWYGAFALLVTLIWLYVEILRLLAKLNSRD